MALITGIFGAFAAPAILLLGAASISSVTKPDPEVTPA
jgi:hypothetical protein